MSVRKIVKTLTQSTSKATVQLGPPRLSGGKSIEECIRTRRSCRSYADDPVTLDDASQLLWAAQGVTGLGGLRTSPSAGAVYPIHCYLVALNIAGLRPGAYAYDPDQHLLSLWKSGDLRKKLVKAAFDQQETDMAGLAVLLTASYGRAKREFGEKGTQLVHMEAGHIGQNFLLQATSLSLGAVGLSKIDNAAMSSTLDLPQAEEPVYLLLAGSK